MSTRREVFYTLSAQRNGDLSGTVTPISTHARYIDAYADGLELPRGWHMRIQRVSVPSETIKHVNAEKFTWHDGDIVVTDWGSDD